MRTGLRDVFQVAPAEDRSGAGPPGPLGTRQPVPGCARWSCLCGPGRPRPTLR